MSRQDDIQIDKTITEKEQDILIDSDIDNPTVEDVKVSLPKSSGNTKIIVSINEDGDIYKYKGDFGYNYKAIQIKNVLEDKDSVKPKYKDGKKVLEIDYPNYVGSKELRHINCEYELQSENIELESKMLDEELGVKCNVVDLEEIENGLIKLTVETVEENNKYEFKMTKYDYDELLAARNAVTILEETVYVTLNKNALDFGDFAIMNDNGVILTDNFEISPYYPLNSFGLTTLLVLPLSFVIQLPFYVSAVALGSVALALTTLFSGIIPILAIAIIISINTQYKKNRFPSWV